MPIHAIAAADNHGDRMCLEWLRNTEKNQDFWFHLGDSGMSEEELKHWFAVKGNNDYDEELPAEQIIHVLDQDILLVHGHQYGHLWAGHYEALVQAAVRKHCSTVLFGHTHIYCDEVMNGIHLLNPGSLTEPRDGSTGTYMALTITEDGISAEKKYYQKPQKKSLFSFFRLR
jgi:putative phosphoesterase